MIITFTIEIPDILAKEKVEDTNEDTLEYHELIERKIRRALLYMPIKIERKESNHD